MRRETGENGQLVGPLDIDLELRPWSRWWLESTLRLAPGTGDLQEVFWRGGLNLWPGSSFTVTNYQRQSPMTQYVQGTLAVTPLEGLRLTYSVRYAALNEVFREHHLLLHYPGVCYKIDASLRMRKAGATDFFIQFNLLSL